MTHEALAVKMFNAYNEEGPTPWKTFDGRDVPRWEGLNDAVRAKWVAAAKAAMVKSETADVLEFMDKFGQTPQTSAGVPFSRPHHVSMRKLVERYDFMLEELHEFLTAIESQNMAELADALVDLVYVAKGTANLMGLPWAQLWDDVHRANMAKERGVGKRGNLVDCVKPDGWQPPKTEAILHTAGYVGNDGCWDDPEHVIVKNLPGVPLDKVIR